MKTFWFDGESAAAHGLMVSGSGTFDMPERDVETVSIPGRNGDLIIDNGRYKNISVSYPASVSTDFPGKAEGIRSWLGSRMGYCRLEDDYDPDHFRLARFQGPLSFTPGFLNRTAECTVTFDCKPQRFLKSGEREMAITKGAVVRNPTGFPAKPLFRITYSGKFVLFVKPENKELWECPAVTVPYAGSEEVYIDFDSLAVWTDLGNGPVLIAGAVVDTITGDFCLDKGTSTITWGEETEGNVKSVAMVPRWWTL